MSLNDHSSRKERLALLKQKSSKRKHEETVDNSLVEATDTESKMRFRNYDPESKGPKLGYLQNHDAQGLTVEDRAEILRDRTLQEADRASQAYLETSTLQTRKGDWDLKRDLDRRLEYVKSKQEFVVAKNVRERILTLRSSGEDKSVDNMTLRSLRTTTE